MMSTSLMMRELLIGWFGVACSVALSVWWVVASFPRRLHRPGRQRHFLALRWLLGGLSPGITLLCAVPVVALVVWRTGFAGESSPSALADVACGVGCLMAGTALLNAARGAFSRGVVFVGQVVLISLFYLTGMVLVMNAVTGSLVPGWPDAGGGAIARQVAFAPLAVVSLRTGELP